MFLPPISIHASHEGSGQILLPVPCLMCHFNSPFPRGKRPLHGLNVRVTCVFQSTLPAGEATGRLMRIFPQVVISIRASRGGSDKSTIRVLLAILHFNPRFPRGKRLFPTGKRNNKYKFQSTLPAGEATTGDLGTVTDENDFNPRFPRGKRRPDHRRS